jgi:hypothetical protein
MRTTRIIPRTVDLEVPARRAPLRQRSPPRKPTVPSNASIASLLMPLRELQQLHSVSAAAALDASPIHGGRRPAPSPSPIPFAFLSVTPSSSPTRDVTAASVVSRSPGTSMKKANSWTILPKFDFTTAAVTAASPPRLKSSPEPDTTKSPHDLSPSQLQARRVESIIALQSPTVASVQRQQRPGAMTVEAVLERHTHVDEVEDVLRDSRHLRNSNEITQRGVDFLKQHGARACGLSPSPVRDRAPPHRVQPFVIDPRHHHPPHRALSPTSLTSKVVDARGSHVTLSPAVGDGLLTRPEYEALRSILDEHAERQQAARQSVPTMARPAP